MGERPCDQIRPAEDAREVKRSGIVRHEERISIGRAITRLRKAYVAAEALVRQTLRPGRAEALRRRPRRFMPLVPFVSISPLRRV
jgi:hypothetical protein